MSNEKWHSRYARATKDIDLDNGNLADKLGMRRLSINNTTCKSGEDKGLFPKWAKALVIGWEIMNLRVKKLEVEIKELKIRLNG